MNRLFELTLSLLGRCPLFVLYGLADVLAFVLRDLKRYRRDVIGENLRAAFPDWTEARHLACMRQVYANLADVLVEVVRAQHIGAEELRQRVVLRGFERVTANLDAGQPMILMAVHQCNWEWLLLRSSLEIEVPVWAVYKPLHQDVVDRVMMRTRSRFGARPVAAREVFMTVVKNRASLHALALVADQIPPRDEEKYWARFLNQDTAFFLGSEKLAKLTRFPVLFVSMRRLARGRYAIDFESLAEPPYALEGHEILERYVERADALIREDPPRWLWSHRRWKYKKPLYS